MASASRSRVLRGDLHVHSSHLGCPHSYGALYSRSTACGRQAIDEMARRARDTGLAYFAAVNHATDPVRPHHADRSTQEKILLHLNEVLRLNARAERGQAVILAGVETSVLPEGGLDVDDAILSHLDVVIAARHGGPRLLPQRLVAQLLAAMDNPHVDIVGCASRSQAELPLAAWEQLAAQAVVTRTAVEVNVRVPMRGSLLHCLAMSGAYLALGSDAHHEESGVASLVTPSNPAATTLLEAVLGAGVKPARVLNLLPTPRLLAWLASRATL